MDPGYILHYGQHIKWEKYKSNTWAFRSCFCRKHIPILSKVGRFIQRLFFKEVGDDCDPESSIFFGPQSVCHVLLCAIRLERSANAQSFWE